MKKLLYKWHWYWFKRHTKWLLTKQRDMVYNALYQSINDYLMNDINKILKNNNLGNLDKLLNKQSTFSKIGEGISKIGSGLVNAFKKIDFMITKYKCYWLFNDTSEYVNRIKNYLKCSK